MIKFLKSLDSFGHPIGVLYRGSTTHNTLFGSFITLIMTTVILGYATMNLVDTVNRSNQQISSTKIIVDRDAEG